MKSVKMAVIGLGHVGAHVAWMIVKEGLADELVLIDSNEAKAKSERQDYVDAAIYLPHKVKITVGDYSDLGDADVIINSTGKITLLIGSNNRDSELNYCVPNVRTYIPKIKASGFHGILINITNPCDVITREFAKGLGLPKGHVFGTGTGLDSARLISSLADQTGVSPKSITAYMIGEHGNAQSAAWSAVSFNGKPLKELEDRPEFSFDHDALQKKAVMGGWVTFSGKHCTEYAIAATAVRDAYAVLHDEKLIVPASMELDGEYGEKDVFAGVPCVLGKDGVEEVLELNLSEEEKAKFHDCCESIRKNFAKADALK